MHGDRTHWRGLSDALSRPLGLPYIMTTGPRWNCHATIGMTGPLAIESFLQIDLGTANNSAVRWTLVVYDIDYQTVACLSSDACPREGWQRVELPGGVYLLTIRYYHCSNEALFPALHIDGSSSIESCPVSDECRNYRAYLEKIRNFGNPFYACLQYYIYFMLLRRKLFSAAFVRRELLPVGNPDTTFFFGLISKGEAIKVDLDPALLDHSLIFFVAYNSCSFPVMWDEITGNAYCSQTLPCNGYFLLRVHGDSMHKHNLATGVRISVQ